MTARNELIARVEARLTRADHVESRSAEIPVSDLRALIALATAPDGWPTEEQIRGCCTAFLSGPTDMCAETEEGEIHEAMRAAILTLIPPPAEVEALTAARASFPSIDRAGPIVTPPEPEWLPWAGGECPVDEDSFVDIKGPNGEAATKARARLCDWRHEDSLADWIIVAYRLVTP